MISSIAVSLDGAVYVSDMNNGRVVKWSTRASEGVVVAGGYGVGSGPHQLDGPMDIVLDNEGALLVADFGNRRVTKWGPLPCIEL